MVIYNVVLRLNLSLIVIYIKHLLVNNKLSSVNINVASLLNGNYILLLFVVLALGLCLGKLRLGSVQLGNSIGVLVVSLLLGQQHFAINTEALNLGFMLFIFCVGVEAGPNFFSIFFRDGKNYLMLALVMVGSAMVIAIGLGKLFHWDIGLTAGMLAGSMTSTPVLVGAGDTLRNTIVNGPALLAAQDHLSLGYALTYLIGLVSLIFGARYLPKLQHQDLSTSAQQIARERGLDTDSQRKVYLPVIRAYRVGPELVAWADGRTCANWASTARPAVTSNASAATAFWPTRTVTQCCRWATRSRWSATRTPMLGWIRASATARKCSIAICSTCASSPKRSW